MSRIDELCAEIDKKFGYRIAQKGVERVKEPKIPFSSVRLNYMFYGGWPRTGICELFGENNGGKTTISLDLMGNAQKVFKREWDAKMKEFQEKKSLSRGEQYEYELLQERGPKKCVFVDAEHSLDEEWAAKNGVDTTEMYWVKPQMQSAEQVLDMMLDFCKSEEVGLMVLDSVPKLVGQNILEASLEKKAYGGISVPLTAFLNRYDTLPLSQKPLIVMINQIRENLGDSWATYVTPGGQALKFACRIRMMVSKGVYLDQWSNEVNKSMENPSGNIVKLAVAKNKYCKPNRRTGQFRLMYDTGVDRWNDLIDTAEQLGLLAKTGSWTSIIDHASGDVLKDADGNLLKFQGRSKLWDYMIAHKEWVDGEFTDEVNRLLSE